MYKLTLVLLPVVMLGGCAGLSHEPPVSTAQTMGAGPPNQMPQPPNSLPPGSQVGAPFTPATGTVGTTRVGPSSNQVPASSAKQPLAGTGTATAPAQPHSVTNWY